MTSRTAPSFMVTSGFADKRTDSYALSLDRFIGVRRRSIEGFWAGAGGEYWRNRIRAQDSSTDVKFHDFTLSASGGYMWMLSRHIYLDSWVAGQFVAGGQRNIQISSQIYKQSVFTPEASIKFGFYF